MRSNRKAEFYFGKKITSLSEGEKVPVYAVSPEHVYETTFSAAPTDAADGNKVTISANGLSVTATTASGVATVYKKGTAAAIGDKVLVRFN